jgi:hypothetical protein
MRAGMQKKGQQGGEGGRGCRSKQDEGTVDCTHPHHPCPVPLAHNTPGDGNTEGQSMCQQSAQLEQGGLLGGPQGGLQPSTPGSPHGRNVVGSSRRQHNTQPIGVHLPKQFTQHGQALRGHRGVRHGAVEQATPQPVAASGSRDGARQQRSCSAWGWPTFTPTCPRVGEVPCGGSENRRGGPATQRGQ